MLWGLGLLAYRVRSQFVKERIDSLTFDFSSKKAGNIPIGASICSLFIAKGINRVILEADGYASYDKCDYPNTTLKAAVKCGLRYLALHGLPERGQDYELDLSWGVAGDEDSPTVEVDASITIRRIDEESAGIIFNYSLEREYA